MKLHILGSSSKGNCYILETQREALILEAGVSIKEVRKALRWTPRKAVGVFVSHEHGDHAAHVREFAEAGIKVFAQCDVMEQQGIKDLPFTYAIRPGKGYTLGGFSVSGMEVKHDVPCLAFLVQHEEMGKLLFVTDTVSFPYTYSGLNTIMIEANYADDIVNGNVERGSLPLVMRQRLLCSHMELEQTKAVLRAQDLSEVGSIVLIHLSDNNSDEQRFVREIRNQTGCPVYAAKAGTTLDISRNPF